uniref:Uncharacterized protein n=1 Tax=Rhizophora mucronata TaxID=61149 RepID=A0A2P2PCN1_RHIMU
MCQSPGREGMEEMSMINRTLRYTTKCSSPTASSQYRKSG